MSRIQLSIVKSRSLIGRKLTCYREDLLMNLRNGKKDIYLVQDEGWPVRILNVYNYRCMMVHNTPRLMMCEEIPNISLQD